MCIYYIYYSILCFIYIYFVFINIYFTYIVSYFNYYCHEGQLQKCIGLNGQDKALQLFPQGQKMFSQLCLLNTLGMRHGSYSHL